MLEGVIDMWSQLRNLQGKTLRTLDRRYPFDVVDVTPTQVILKLHRTRKQRRILKDEIVDSFGELKRQGKISRARIEDNYSLRKRRQGSAISLRQTVYVLIIHFWF